LQGAISNAVSGRLADKIEIKHLGFIGAALHFSGWMMSSFMQSFHFLFIVFILAGIGASFAFVPALASVLVWIALTPNS
jgi:predicted MFS family arabinose efflux permease